MPDSNPHRQMQCIYDYRQLAISTAISAAISARIWGKPYYYLNLGSPQINNTTKMEIPKNALNWFEIPVNDFDRARKFYSQIFDYEMPESHNGYKRIGLFLYNQDGGAGGAIVQGAEYLP